MSKTKKGWLGDTQRRREKVEHRPRLECEECHRIIEKGCLGKDGVIRCFFCDQSYARGEVIEMAKEKRGTKAAKEKMAKVRAARKERGPGIGKFVYELLSEQPDMTTEKILGAVLDKFPGARTSKACIAWYRSHYYQDKGMKRPKKVKPAPKKEVKKTKKGV